jgi:hypothetical protein
VLSGSRDTVESRTTGRWANARTSSSPVARAAPGVPFEQSEALRRGVDRYRKGRVAFSGKARGLHFPSRVNPRANRWPPGRATNANTAQATLQRAPPTTIGPKQLTPGLPVPVDKRPPSTRRPLPSSASRSTTAAVIHARSENRTLTQPAAVDGRSASARRSAPAPGRQRRARCGPPRTAGRGRSRLDAGALLPQPRGSTATVRRVVGTARAPA